MQLIFDIGSNVGNFCHSWSQLHPDCSFICVEPNIDFLLLNADTMYDKCNNIKILPYAAGAEDNREADFYINDLFHTISTCNEAWVNDSRFNNLNAKWDRKVVKTITIETLIKKYGMPDYLKIDVEGFELTALHGLASKVPLLSFEWAEELCDEMLNCVNYLYSIGYSDFYMKEFDDYIDIPDSDSFYDLNSCIELINSLDPSRKDKWGQIFAK